MGETQASGKPGLWASLQRRGLAGAWPAIREMGGASRNPAPRNHFLMQIVKPPGCHDTDGH